MSLLTIVQNTCRLVGIPVPASVVTSNDTQVQQLYALCNEEGRDLASSFNWQALRRQYTFTTVAQAAQTDAIPDDVDRFISNSFFNRTTLRQMFGPITPQRWQAIQVYPQFAGIYLAFIERDNEFLITPTPPADETIAYEYITSNWCENAAGDEGHDEFEADDDVGRISEQLISLGLRWRFKAAKGLDYAEDLKTYEMQKAQVQARDGGATAINTGGDPYYNWRANVPEGNFPTN